LHKKSTKRREHHIIIRTEIPHCKIHGDKHFYPTSRRRSYMSSLYMKLFFRRTSYMIYIIQVWKEYCYSVTSSCPEIQSSMWCTWPQYMNILYDCLLVTDKKLGLFIFIFYVMQNHGCCHSMHLGNKCWYMLCTLVLLHLVQNTVVQMGLPVWKGKIVKVLLISLTIW
jgi:hypothetical protein